MTDLASLFSNPQLLTLIIGFGYAAFGYFDAVRNGQEQFDVIQFGKTVVTFGLAAGFVTPSQASGAQGLLAVLASSGGAYVIDQATSKLLSAHRAGGSKPPPAPAPAPSS